MSGLKNYMGSKYPEFTTSELYFGYMDMTYFAFTPLELKKRNLKIAVVFLHEQNRFEVWLGGRNRKVQVEYLEQFKGKNIGNYKLSQMRPGVDSIIEMQIVDQPNFEPAEDLVQIIEGKTIEFANNIISILTE